MPVICTCTDWFDLGSKTQASPSALASTCILTHWETTSLTIAYLHLGQHQGREILAATWHWSSGLQGSLPSSWSLTDVALLQVSYEGSYSNSVAAKLMTTSVIRVTSHLAQGLRVAERSPKLARVPNDSSVQAACAHRAPYSWTASCEVCV